MHPPSLHELPSPPAGYHGWPWTEPASERLTAACVGKKCPRISIVTPSYNQASFLEETIRSVLLQAYPNLEYIVMDGGSSDGSVDIIRKYSRWIDYWVTNRDHGQSDAINQGVAKATGQFAAWINSDDLLCKDALLGHACSVGFEDNLLYVGYCIYIDEESHRHSIHRGRVYSLEDLVRIKTIWRSEAYRSHIDQPATIFPRHLFLNVGGLNVDNHCTMDYELWGELMLAGVEVKTTDIEFGMFRTHSAQKTHDMLRQTQSLVDVAAMLTRKASCFSEATKNDILDEIKSYHAHFRKEHWKGTGRLARMGLPPALVEPIRRLRSRFQNNV